MSGYIVEEINEVPVFINTPSYEVPVFINISTNEEVVEYWRLYSPHQEKRFKKVLYQLRETWYDVFKTVRIINETSNTNIDKDIMPKIYRMFMIEHKHKTEFYNDEKIRLRKKKDYISKKIYKLKSTKQKI